MNFAQVCGVVTCAVTAFMGCGTDRDAVGSDAGTSTIVAVALSTAGPRASVCSGDPDEGPGDLPPAATGQPPIAVDDVLVVDEDRRGAVNVLANDRDPDGDALSAVIAAPPASGRASISSGIVLYTPQANFHGTDAVGYRISDGHGNTATATLRITVNSVPDAPSAHHDFIDVAADGSATFDPTLNDSDGDGDALTLTAITGPAHGTATRAGNLVTYTPDPGFRGDDEFEYSITDGHDGVSTASIFITVSSTNDPPIAVDDSLITAEDSEGAVDLVANDSDPDGQPLTVVAFDPPAHGTVTVAGRVATYRPARDYNGPDSFHYMVQDPAGATATAMVRVTVTPVNDAPGAIDDAAALAEDTAVTVDVVANDLDVDGDALVITAITQPAHGLAALVDGHRVSYMPAPDYHGSDAVTYTISDGNGGQSAAVLSLAVTSVNDPPVAAPAQAALDEDGAVSVAVVASDVDGDVLAIARVTQPGHGSAAITGPREVTYTPVADFHGTDSFTYTVDDGQGGEATAQVTVEVANVNDPPVAIGDAASLLEDTAVTVDVVANDRDVDGDPLVVTGVSQPAHGAAAVLDASHVRYTPAGNFHGGDAFSYTISDGNGGTATAQVVLTVTGVNDPPVASDGELRTFDGTPATTRLTASDVDGDALVFAIASAPAHGTLGALAGDRVQYTPAPGFTGSDAFTFIASDGQASSAPATVQITVTHSVCGNGVREGREECDDGNPTPGDGCEPTCELSCGSGTGADRATVDPASGHCFAGFDAVQHDHRAAAALCTALGGHLPTITSAGEDAAARAAAGAGDTPWLGAAAIAAPGTFGWSTAEPFGYSHFHAGEPDNAGNAGCLHYLADGTWAAAPCTAAATGALCEFELVEATPAFATGGGGTRAVALGDFNGDGRTDAAALNPAGNSVGVLLGDGAGGFALQATYPIGAGGAALAAADLDGDGRLDLAVASASTLSVLRGTPGGGFSAAGSVAIAAGATALVVADFTQDGVLDVAIAATSTVQLLRGTGSGFSVLGSLAVTGAPAAIAAGDFNRDGQTDLAIATASAVQIATATGAGAFAAPVTLATAPSSRAVIARDLDGDGNLDLVVGGGAGSVSVWFGSAPGAFGAPVSLGVAAAPTAVAAADFDGDGGTDLVAVTGNFATLWHGAGRTFTQGAPLVTTGGAGASAAAAGDINGDAAADLVVANAATSSAGVLLGRAGGLAGARALPAGTAAAATVSADFNEDGRADLAVVDPATSRVFAFVQSAAGALVPSVTANAAPGGGANHAVAADFDGDGHVDLAVVNVTFSSVSVLRGAGDGTFGPPLNTGTGPGPRRPVVADINGDGKPDLVVPRGVNNAVTVMVNTSGGRFGAVDVLVTGSPAAVAVGDFNADGKKDIAVATAGDTSVKLLLGLGGTAFAAPVAFQVGTDGGAIAAGDVDGDGKLDVVATTAATAAVSILGGTGTGSFTGPASVAVGAQPAVVAIVDLDGDTRLDVVVGNAGTNDVTVLHGTPTGGLVASSFALGVPPSALTVADLDRDGHLDIAAASGNSFATLLYSAR